MYFLRDGIEVTLGDRDLDLGIHQSLKLDDLLDLSVLENGRVALDIGVGTLGDLLDRAISSVALGDDLVIKRSRSREDVIVETDFDRLAQVFINLIRNAEKYCDAPSPKLRIAVRDQGGVIQIDFVDNGSGIAPEAREVIFEKFSRLSDGMRAGGTGLGLAICREVMANLSGSIASFASGMKPTNPWKTCQRSSQIRNVTSTPAVSRAAAKRTESSSSTSSVPTWTRSGGRSPSSANSGDTRGSSFGVSPA